MFITKPNKTENSSGTPYYISNARRNFGVCQNTYLAIALYKEWTKDHNAFFFFVNGWAVQNLLDFNLKVQVFTDLGESSLT